MKVCSMCTTEKPLGEFGLDRGKPRNVCRACDSARQRAWYAANRERALAYQREKYQANPESKKQQAIEWQKANPEKVRVKNRRKNDKNRVRAAAWRQANPEKVFDYGNRRRAAKKATGAFTIPQSFLKRLYASSCFYCGSTDRIEADHVMPLSRGGKHSMSNLIPACRGCNASKNNKTVMEWRLSKI